MTTLEQAQKDLEDFLNQYPHLIPMQRELEREMEGKTAEERMKIIRDHMKLLLEELRSL